jgi:hypothetical protein
VHADPVSLVPPGLSLSLLAFSFRRWFDRLTSRAQADSSFDLCAMRIRHFSLLAARFSPSRVSGVRSCVCGVKLPLYALDFGPVCGVIFRGEFCSCCLWIVAG